MNTLNVQVWRGGGAEGSFQHFEVPRHASQTVLDVVTHIQRALDPTLAYRFACRVGMCGSCAMTVNGVPRWTCRTHVDKVAQGRAGIDDRAAAQPAGDPRPRHRHARVLRQVGAREGQLRGQPYAHATTFARDCARSTRAQARSTPPSSASAAPSATPPATSCRGTRTTSGPAALNRAWTLVNDERDTAAGASACARSRATPAATAATPT